MLRQTLAERALPQDGETRTASTKIRRARSVTVNLTESPLGWLKVRGMIDDRQFAGGEMLRRDYERANLAPSVTMNWNALPMDRNRRGARRVSAASDGQIAAKQRFDAAIAEAGPGLSDILWRVVCAGEGVPTAEKELGWPARAGRLVLGLALDRVAGYYRVS